MKRQNARTLVLLVVTFGFLLLGAIIFDKLESTNEQAEKNRLEKLEKELKQNLNITDEDFETLRSTILQSKPYNSGIQWKFAGGLYFALSVITTIGYGHSTPKTLGGKLFCICYATIGIPLNIVMFQSIGERFNILLAYLIGAAKRCLHLRNTKVGEFESAIVGGVLCGVVLTGGAAAFQKLEQWSYVESFYFCFITMSTIGFGDYVALQNDTTEALQTQPGYVAFCIIYILCGLTVFAAALNKMVLGLLTMNTADERKDELQAQEDAMRNPTLDGDILITNSNYLHNAEMSTSHIELEQFSVGTNRMQDRKYSSTLTRKSNGIDKDCLQDLKSTYLKPAINRRKLHNRLKLANLRYSAKHKPCQSISHLLPAQSLQHRQSMQTGFTPLLAKRNQLSFLSINGEQQTSRPIGESSELHVNSRRENAVADSL
ncbi:potassium channel subfamily K member 15-like [Watersipora subatra]|uniref:potassium channel subfamily K member 15-like n=1 Tax=Watersipora subatra TaxID=2589382 RepID=UPI00355C3FD2